MPVLVSNSKTYKQAQYEAHLAKLAKVTKENYKDSGMFKQNAYTAAELWWHKQASFALTVAIFYLVGFEYELLQWLILNLPFPEYFGKSIKTVSICFWSILPAYLAACLFKLYIYWLLAFIWGFEPL